jgi:hypothetical protein
MGKSSNHVSSFPQFSHFDLPASNSGILNPLSNLYIKAFRKLAKIVPRMNRRMYVIRNYSMKKGPEAPSSNS